MCQGKAALTRIGQRTLEEALSGQFKKVKFDSKEGKQLHLGPGAQSDLLSQGISLLVGPCFQACSKG